MYLDAMAFWHQSMDDGLVFAGKQNSTHPGRKKEAWTVEFYGSLHFTGSIFQKLPFAFFCFPAAHRVQEPRSSQNGGTGKGSYAPSNRMASLYFVSRLMQL